MVEVCLLSSVGNMYDYFEKESKYFTLIARKEPQAN